MSTSVIVGWDDVDVTTASVVNDRILHVHADLTAPLVGATTLSCRDNTVLTEDQPQQVSELHYVVGFGETNLAVGAHVFEMRMENTAGASRTASRTLTLVGKDYNQAWAPAVGQDGPYVVGTSGTYTSSDDDWDWTNDSFWLGAVGAFSPTDVIEWKYNWEPGSSGGGYSGYGRPPVFIEHAATATKPRRVQIKPQIPDGSYGNYYSGVLTVTMYVNGQPAGDQVTLTLGGDMYAMYDASAWAVLVAPIPTPTLEFDIVPNVWAGGSLANKAMFVHRVRNNSPEVTITADLLAVMDWNLAGQNNVGVWRRGIVESQISVEGNVTVAKVVNGSVESSRLVTPLLNDISNDPSAVFVTQVLHGGWTPNEHVKLTVTLPPLASLEIRATDDYLLTNGTLQTIWSSSMVAFEETAGQLLEVDAQIDVYDRYGPGTVLSDFESELIIDTAVNMGTNPLGPDVVAGTGQWSMVDGQGAPLVYQGNGRYVTPNGNSYWQIVGTDARAYIHSQNLVDQIVFRWTSYRRNIVRVNAWLMSINAMNTFVEVLVNGQSIDGTGTPFTSFATEVDVGYVISFRCAAFNTNAFNNLVIPNFHVANVQNSNTNISPIPVPEPVIDFTGNGTHTFMLSVGNELGTIGNVQAFQRSATGVMGSYPAPTETLLTSGYVGNYIKPVLSRYNGKFAALGNGRNRFLIAYTLDTGYFVRVPINNAPTNQVADAGLSMSGEGRFMVMQEAGPGYTNGDGYWVAQAKLVAYEWSGTAYDRVHYEALADDERATSIKISGHNGYVAVAVNQDTFDGMSNTSRVLVYKYSEDLNSFQLMQTIPVPQYAEYQIELSCDGKIMVIWDAYSGEYVRAYKRSGETWSEAPALGNSVPVQINDISISGDNNTWAISRQGTDLLIYTYDGTSLSQINSNWQYGADSTGGECEISVDGQFIFTKNVSVTQGCYMRRVDASYYERVGFSYHANPRPLGVALAVNKTV